MTSTMTPKQAKGPASLVDVAGDIRTQITAIVVAVQALGFVAQTPGEKRLVESMEARNREVATLRAEVSIQRVRSDSLVRAISIIERLAKVKCRETRDFGIRTLLECD